MSTKATFSLNIISGSYIGVQSQIDIDGDVLINNNHISNNEYSGISVTLPTNLNTRVFSNHIEGNLKNGITSTNGASPEITDCTILGSGEHGIFTRDISSPKIYNTSINGSGEYDFWVGERSTPLLVGSFFDSARVFFNDTQSLLSFGWWVRFQVQDNDSTPVGGASYWVNASDNSTAHEGLTLPTGRSSLLVIIEKELRLDGVKALTPHTFTASKGLDHAEEEIEITGNGEVLLTLAQTIT